MVKKILFFALTLFSVSAFTQQQYISYTSVGRGVATTFVNDYHALGINPANLGFSDNNYEKPFTTGSTELAFSVYSDSLSKTDLRRNLLTSVKPSSEFTRQERLAAASEFTGSNFALNFDFNIMGFSYQNEKLGGIAFGIRERAQWFSNVSENLSELIYLGNTASFFDSLLIQTGTDSFYVANDGNLSEDSLDLVARGKMNTPLPFADLLDGSQIRLSWNREYHLSYGKRIVNIDSVLSIYGGAGVKYVQALAMFDFSAANGVVTANSALTPLLGIDYGDAAIGNPSAMGTQSGFLPESVGHGWGVDFGVTAILFNKLRIGTSVTNIGSVTYNGNVYTLKDTLVTDFSTEGVTDYNNMASVSQLVSGDGILELEGEESITVSLPALFRFGASLELGEKVHVGVETIMPFNKELPGSLNGAILGLGGDVKVVDWLTLSAGFVTGGNYDFQIPLGINFVLGEGAYEFGFASRDAVTFFTQNTPTISMAMGFARVRF